MPASQTGVERRDQDADALHRHAENQAMEAAKKSGDRMKTNEAGNDIINK
ncbi:MAG TPA: hypothetical protein VFN53_02235 [Acidobacteriaceae bacterium]|nr:hypothetical protein [Acidobacteriaceae bacterium]